MSSSKLIHRVGPGSDRASHIDKWLSATGGLVGLMGVMLISQAHLGTAGSVGLVASMGASAVLLFAVPHGPLSQPWPVFGGHLVSAIVGVAAARAIADPLLAAPLAVALAIGTMHYLRCIHPPGGATALSAVVGGEAVHQLGFQYVLTPVMLNAGVILIVALAFNYPFRWRRYPVALARRAVHEPSAAPGPTANQEQSHERSENPPTGAGRLRTRAQEHGYLHGHHGE